MTENAVKDLILRLSEPLARTLGLVVWGVEVAQANRTIIRLFVDLPPGQNEKASPNIDMCEKISRALGIALEVEDCIPDAYVLEVSTPGLSRVFFNQAQMRAYVGDIVEARVYSAPPDALPTPRKLWRGKLLSVEDTTFTIAPVTVSEEGDVSLEDIPPVCLPWDTVRRAHRVHIFHAPVKPGKTSKKHPENTDETAICTPRSAAVGGTA